MKSILITASALGAAIAGLVLHFQKKSKPANKMINARKTLNNGIAQIERPAHHTMG